MMNVLQRIALCYGAVVTIHLLVEKVYMQIGIVAACEVIYLGFMYGLDVPKCGRGKTTEYCNAGAYIDRKIFGDHCYMWEYTEPEGLLSTFSAVSTIYLGYLFGKIMEKLKGDKDKLGIIWFLLGGVLAGVMGMFSHVIPFNKKIWSFSFGIFSGAAAGLVLNMIFITEDIMLPGSKIVEFVNKPFVWYGMNPLAIYVGNYFLNIILRDWITWNDRENNVLAWLYKNLFDSWMTPLITEYGSSFMFAFFQVCVWMVVARFLHKYKVFIKL